MPSQETWERFHDEVNIKVNDVMDAIMKLTVLGERLGGKIDALHERMDSFDKEIISLKHTINGNTVPGLKTRQAVTESRVKLISGLLAAVVVTIIFTYMGLK